MQLYLNTVAPYPSIDQAPEEQIQRAEYQIQSARQEPTTMNSVENPKPKTQILFKDDNHFKQIAATRIRTSKPYRSNASKGKLS